MITCDGRKVGLAINPAEVSDTGDYACLLANPVGEAESRCNVAIRKVFQKPNFVQKFTDLQQLPMYDAKFPAKVVGVPQPELKWYHNDKPIKENDKYKMKYDGDTCCLYITDCEAADEGLYSCVAKNREGQASCEARLDVVDKMYAFLLVKYKILIT
jgi:hypothetical protein